MINAGVRKQPKRGRGHAKWGAGLEMNASLHVRSEGALCSDGRPVSMRAGTTVAHCSSHGDNRVDATLFPIHPRAYVGRQLAEDDIRCLRSRKAAV